jgi:hypothetical protein
MSLPTTVNPSELAPLVDAAAQAVEERVIAWRRDGVRVQRNRSCGMPAAEKR